MNTIDTFRSVNTPLQTGAESGSTAGTSLVSTQSVTVSGVIAGSFQSSVSSLESMGLPAPSSPGDVEALFAALWLAVEERIKDGRLIELEAKVATVQTTLGAFRAAIEAKVTLAPVYEAKVQEKSDRTAELQALHEKRDKLEDKVEKLDRKIEKADTSIEKADLRDEKKKVQKKLEDVYDDIASLETQLAGLGHEIAGIADAISQSETAYVMLLAMIVRERAPVDPDTESQDTNRVQNLEEKLRVTGDTLNAMAKNDILWREFLAAGSKNDLKSDEERALEFQLALTALQIVLQGLPVGENGGILSYLPEHSKGSGGRLQLTV